MLWALLVAVVSVAAEGIAEPPQFARDVAPVLRRNCVGCHGPDEQNGGLRLDSYAALMRGGDSGPPVIPGNSWESLIIKKVDHRDKPTMPPKKKLAPAVIEPIRAWIDAGARP